MNNYYEDYEGTGKMQRPGKFNFGAFIYPIPWGIANRCFLPLLVLIPVFGIVWHFVCGFRANAWAAKNNNYRDALELARVQTPWHRLGVVTFVFILLTIAVLLILFLGLNISI